MAKGKDKLLNSISKIINSRKLSVDMEDLQAHAKDRSFHKESLPDVVIWPETSKDVSAVMKLANRFKIPVTAWGGGSSLEGNPIPVRGGIVLDMTKMDKIIHVDQKSFQVRLQPGIIGDEFNRQLGKYKLFFPAAPGSSNIATIGGMIANNAGGMYAVKYGVVGDWVLELEVVLPDGRIVKVGSKSFKSVSGYDLKRLFIGSEGTLGIVTETTLKLRPIPANKMAAFISFSTLEHIVATSLEILQKEINPAAIEYMDTEYIKLVNLAKKSNLSESPSLIVEFHGDEKINADSITKLETICRKHSALAFKKFMTKEGIKILWEYRKAVRPVLSKILPNTGVLSAEIGLPLASITSFLHKAEKISKKYRMTTVMFGHMGDGNFHGWALYKLGDKKSWERVVKVNEELVRFSLKSGGTTTGEHGMGIGKRKFLALEHPTSLPIMKEIKRLFDPKGILNPGKIFLD